MKKLFLSPCAHSSALEVVWNILQWLQFLLSYCRFTPALFKSTDFMRWRLSVANAIEASVRRK